MREKIILGCLISTKKKTNLMSKHHWFSLVRKAMNALEASFEIDKCLTVQNPLGPGLV